MQAITREMNYSETTFVEALPHDDGAFDVRIFTPGRELPFAGHPTLGTAFVLRHLLGISDHPIRLREPIGDIPVTVEGEGQDETLWMTQASPTFATIYQQEEIAYLLGLRKTDIDPAYPVQEVNTGLTALIVPVASLKAAVSARLNLEGYRTYLANGGPSSILLFAKETVNADCDLHVRVFVGDWGIPEDPATGSANGALAGYLAHYRVMGDSVDLKVEQGLEIGRPSVLYLRASQQSDNIEVKVGGHVVLVAEGRLLEPPV